MTSSRQADDPKRFKLQMTDEGPRFVLGTTKEGPVRVDTVIVPPPAKGVESPKVAPKLDLDLNPQVTTLDAPATVEVVASPSVVAAVAPVVPPSTITEAPVVPLKPEAVAEASAPSKPEVSRKGDLSPKTGKHGKSRKGGRPASSPLPQLARAPKMEAPTETQTVLDAAGNDRLPNAYWKATLPPNAVPADYTVEAGVERVHAPTASPEEAMGLLQEAEEAAAPAPDSPKRAPAVVDLVVRAGRVTVPRGLIASIVVLAVGMGIALQMWPAPQSEDVLVPTHDRTVAGRARLAQSHTSRLFARGLDGELQKSLSAGLYVVVGRKEDGTMSNEAIVEDMMTRDLESAQKLARIKSEALGQPLFIIAKRDGEVAIVDRVNPGDRTAWRDYTMNVWYLKQHALAWSRERYMSREALDPKRTVAVMSDFVRSHPDSRVVGPALEDMRYVCYYALQDPGKFRVVTLALLDETLQSYDRQRVANVPELVYVMKPYLKEAMNQLLYQRIHRLTVEQTSLHPTNAAADLGTSRHI